MTHDVVSNTSIDSRHSVCNSEGNPFLITSYEGKYAMIDPPLLHRETIFPGYPTGTTPYSFALIYVRCSFSFLGNDSFEPVSFQTPISSQIQKRELQFVLV